MEECSNPNESATTIIMREMVMPHHANPQNTIFGGTVMSWVDIAAAMCATKHARRQVVTVHVDEVTFEAPVKVGYHVCIKASLNYVGNTSMEIGVRVESENPLTGETRKTTSAHLTFVAIDEFGKAQKVPPYTPQSKDEIRRYENAKKRVKARKELKASLQS